MPRFKRGKARKSGNPPAWRGRKFYISGSKYRETGLTKTGFRNVSSASNYKSKGSIAWGGSPFPRELTTQLTYAENFTLSSTTGIPATYLFSANGLYDPNVTGTGSQPRFFDTLCGANNTTAPYNNYRVYAGKITVEVIPTGSDSTSMRGFIGVGLYNTTATGPSTLAEMRMRVDYKTRFLGYWSGGHDVARISRYADFKTLFGIKDMKDDPNVVGDSTANPSKSARWAVTYCPSDESSSRDVKVLVKIRYYVSFFDRNDVADS